MPGAYTRIANRHIYERVVHHRGVVEDAVREDGCAPSLAGPGIVGPAQHERDVPRSPGHAGDHLLLPVLKALRTFRRAQHRGVIVPVLVRARVDL